MNSTATNGEAKTAFPPFGDNYIRIDSAQTLSVSLIQAVTGLCDQAEDAPGEAVLVLHVVGRERADNDGAWPGEVGIQLVSKWERALRRFERADVATIAIAEGPCRGPALNVLLAADYRIGTSSLRLSLTSGGDVVWPGMAVHRLANQIGVARAKQLVLFGMEVDAERAREIGLVDEITADPAASVAAVAELAAGLTGAELAIRRRLLLDAATTGFDESLGAHLAACDRTLRRVHARGDAGRLP
jgi:isomerase DpgB